MKKIIFLFAFLQISVCLAQRPNGGRRGGGNSGQPSAEADTPKFEAQKVAGILEYEPKKVFKKIKLKKKDSIAKEISKHLTLYNSEINKIKTTNKDLLEGLDIVVNQNMDAAIKTRNRELMQETRKMIDEKLKPIQEQVKAQQDTLNLSLASILTEDQNEKWLSYQKSERENLMPKRRGNDARNRPDDVTKQSRRQRG